MCRSAHPLVTGLKQHTTHKSGGWETFCFPSIIINDNNVDFVLGVSFESRSMKFAWPLFIYLFTFCTRDLLSLSWFVPCSEFMENPCGCVIQRRRQRFSHHKGGFLFPTGAVEIKHNQLRNNGDMDTVKTVAFVVFHRFIRSTNKVKVIILPSWRNYIE